MSSLCKCAGRLFQQMRGTAFNLSVDEHSRHLGPLETSSSAKYGRACLAGQTQTKHACLKLALLWRDMVSSSISSEKPSGGILVRQNFMDKAVRKAIEQLNAMVQAI